ncbi:MAG: hypothetical protein ACLFPJ_02670 [Candidatus Woesearchaeota archaeon]
MILSNLKINLKYLVYVFMFIFVINFCLGEIVVFNNYETTIHLQDGKLHVIKELTLENVGSDPIIPGELHFKIHELKKGEKIPSEILNFNTINGRDQELDSRVIEGNTETDLVVSVWEPILPKFSYKIFLTYDIVFEPKGFLFYEFNVPTEDTTIPIKKNQNIVLIPSNYKVTFAKDASVSQVTKDDKKFSEVKWTNTGNMVLEYSKIPLPKTGVKAVNLFWSVIIILTILATFIIHKKLR